MPLDENTFSPLWATQLSSVLKTNKGNLSLKCYSMKIILESLVFKNGVFNVFTPFNKDEEKINNYLFKLLKTSFDSMNLEE